MTAMPDGIRAEHASLPSARTRHANPIGVIVLGVLVAVAMLGFAGRERTTSASGGGVEMTLHAPELIRSGEFFEFRLEVRTATAVDDLVIAIPVALWEDVTINTMIPAPAEESSEAGEILLAYGPFEPGSTFVLKVDAQINPDILGPNEGTLRISDGDVTLVELPVTMGVLP